MSAVPNLTHASLIEHQAFVLRLARSLLNDEATAQDVAQETMLAALRHPPEHGRIRAWLARVVKHRASDRARSESRRAAREAASARPEAIEGRPSPRETLEIQVDVVNAVLALDEPYRAVVIATYYEGLSPAEIAGRGNAPAATVRSQLFRAHQMLKARLAREHGDESSVWQRALAVFVQGHGDAASEAAGSAAGADAPTSAGEPPAPSTPRAPSAPHVGSRTGATASSSSMLPLLVAGGLTVLLAGGVTWYVAQIGDDLVARPSAPLVANSERRATALDATRPTPGDRLAVSPPTTVPAPADDVAAMGPDDLLARSRQLKAAILTRRLAVADADLDRRLADRADAGVVKLIDRSSLHQSLDYPGARGSGAYYSFSERAHDFDRRPQIGFEDGLLQATQTETSGWIIDLGARELFEVQSSLPQSPFPADPLRTIVWETMLSRFHASMKGDMNWDMLQAEFETRRDRAHADGRIVDADLLRMPALDTLRFARAVPGHTYLLRSLSHRQFDLAVLLTVVRLEGDACTIRWQRLPGYPEDEDRNPSVMDDVRAAVPAVPSSLASQSEPELTAELERVRTRADALLFARFSEATEARYGHLRTEKASGLVRCTKYLSEWGELSREPLTGASHFSFFHGRHAARTNDLRPNTATPGTTLPSLESAGQEGYVVDLGALPLESVTTESVGAAKPEAVRFLSDFDFEDVARQRIAAQSTAGGAARIVDASLRVPANSPVWSDVFRQYHRHLWDLLGIGGTPSVVGHTYLVRAFSPGETDVLAAFTVAEADRYGVVIAWRLLRGTNLSERR